MKIDILPQEFKFKLDLEKWKEKYKSNKNYKIILDMVESFNDVVYTAKYKNDNEYSVKHNVFILDMLMPSQEEIYEHDYIIQTLNEGIWVIVE